VRRGWWAGAIVFALVVAVVVLVWKPFHGGNGDQALDSRARGFSATVPSGWTSEVPGDNSEVLFRAWTGDLSHPASDPVDCAAERRSFTASVYVQEWTKDAAVNRQPGKPFDESSGTGLLTNTDGYECGERVQVWTWDEQGRRLQAGVVVGADGAKELANAYAILNSLRVRSEG
jgi:hypothetical protein